MVHKRLESKLQLWQNLCNVHAFIGDYSEFSLQSTTYCFEEVGSINEFSKLPKSCNVQSFQSIHAHKKFMGDKKDLVGKAEADKREFTAYEHMYALP
jgi:hypothetical protein